MRAIAALLILFGCGMSVASAQQLSAEDKKVLNAARSRYYDLASRGLDSFQCSAKFDLATIPLPLLPLEDVADRKLLQNTSFLVKYERRGPEVTPSYPADTSELAKTSVAQTASWMTSIISGFL